LHEVLPTRASPTNSNEQETFQWLKIGNWNPNHPLPMQRQWAGRGAKS
jgi:hypothetical protein